MFQFIAPEVLHMKDIDVGFSCWCRCTMKVKYSYTFPQKSHKIFSIPAGVTQHFYPSPWEPRNTSFHPCGNSVVLPDSCEGLVVDTCKIKPIIFAKLISQF